MKIGLASDHRGYKLKEGLKKELEKRKYTVVDYGTNSEESTDYPDYAFKLGENVRDKNVDFGVAICGSGIGISIACNKVKGVRCAKVSNIEEAIVTRNDNNSNIIAFGEQISLEDAINLVIGFINTPFSSLEKHHRRVQKIKDYEEKNNG
jgi:ribose 5-phosphate isomerase B